MKKIKKSLLVIFVLMSVVCCKAGIPKDYATFSGEITNYKNYLIYLYPCDPSCTVKPIEIKTANDGTFSESIPIKENDGTYFSVKIENKDFVVFFKKGDKLNIAVDMESFEKTLKFKGNHAVECEYFFKCGILSKAMFSFYKLDEESFIKKTKKTLEKKVFLLEDYKDKIEKKIYLEEQEYLSNLSQMDLKKDYKIYKKYMRLKKERKAKYESLKGKQSPEFTNYENFKSGTSSLKDFKGKYVFINIWAPCWGGSNGTAEFPSLRKLEKQYSTKNIVFLSIYKSNNNKQWKQILKNEKIENIGVQLIIQNNNDSFLKAYCIERIPHFMVLDPEGKIVTADAPKPSDPKLIKLFDELGL